MLKGFKVNRIDKRWKEALDEFNKATEFYHKDIQVYYSRKNTYLNFDNYDQAIARILSGLCHYKQAIADYNKAIEPKPKHAEAYYNWAVTFDKLGKHKQAIAEILHQLNGGLSMPHVDVHIHGVFLVTASQQGTFRHYNTLGMFPLQNGTINAEYLTAVYIKPQKMKGLSGNRALLEFVGMKSVSNPGKIRVCLEKTKVTEFNIMPGEARTYKTEINYNFKDDAPHSLLIYFFGENNFYLPAKQGNKPAFQFETIHLSRK